MSVFVSLINPEDSITDFLFSSFKPNEEMNKKYWLKIKESYFFVIHKFSNANSIKIINAIKTDKKSLIFDDTGNVVYKDLKFINPLVRGAVDNSRTLEDIEKLNPKTYFSTPDMILSQNLQYILYNKGGIYYLLYNPIHRKYLRNYYDNIPEDELDIAGRTYRGTHNIDSVFKTYCDAVSDSTTNQYADPTCGCFKSFDSCKKNAFLGGNVVDYSNIPNSDNEGILSAIGENCVCKAPACQYTGILNGESFLSKYKSNVSPCDNDIILSYCSMVNNAAGDINLSDSYLAQNCAQDGFTELIKKDDTTPPTATPTPPTTTPPTTTPTPTPTPPTTTPPTTTPPTTTPTPTPPTTTPPTVDNSDELKPFPRIDPVPETPQEDFNFFLDNSFAKSLIANGIVSRDQVPIVYIVIIVLIIIILIGLFAGGRGRQVPFYY